MSRRSVAPGKWVDEGPRASHPSSVEWALTAHHADPGGRAEARDAEERQMYGMGADGLAAHDTARVQVPA